MPAMFACESKEEFHPVVVEPQTLSAAEARLIVMGFPLVPLLPIAIDPE
jgi:hypothetical protein